LGSRSRCILADAYNIQGFYDWGVPEEIFPKARAAAVRALELDRSLAEAHNSLGYTAVYFDWDEEGAEREFLRALELNPDYAVARQWYGNFLVAAGRFEDAYREMERAIELDPLTAITRGALAWAHYHARDMDTAVAIFAEVLVLEPEFPPALMWKSLAHLGLGEVEMAQSEIAKAVTYSGEDPGVIAVQTYIMAVAGETEAARSQVELLEAERDVRYISSYELAKVYVALDDLDRAFQLLEQAFADRSHAMVFLKLDPALSQLQDDPRFRDLVERVGFNIQ
jgi:Tfp pilus assembly protein PilF